MPFSIHNVLPNAPRLTRPRRVAVDLVPIRVGEGGTGSGIWTYARELLHAIDQQDLQGMEIVCLINSGQRPYLSGLQNIRLIEFSGGGKNILKRLFWIHFKLPLFCFFRKVDVLHKLATDTPLFCPASRITTVHDFYYEFLMENHPPETIRLYERLENAYFSLVTRTCFRKSRSIIAVSEATRQEAIRRYPIAADRIHVIHHGAPIFSQNPVTKSVLSQADEQSLVPNDSASSITDPECAVFKILCVAKFMEHKGQHLLIDAFEALLDQYPEWIGRVRLELRGFHNDAKYCGMIEQRISASRFSNAMEIIDFDANDRLEAIYRNADLVVLLSSYEGFGLPVIEAQAMGVPVLCSDLSVLKEVGGDGAVYVDRTDRAGVTDALRRFVEDASDCDVMRGKALENVSRFSWDKAAEQTVNVYR